MIAFHTVAIESRFSAYTEVHDLFGFLEIKKLITMNKPDITESAIKLISTYKNDLDIEFIEELLHYKSYCKDNFKNEIIITVYNDIKEMKILYPNIEIALRIYLTLMTSNASSERSFSKLKIVKNYLRNSLIEEKLSDLCLLSLESDILDNVDIDDIIQDFINKKIRKHTIK